MSLDRTNLTVKAANAAEGLALTLKKVRDAGMSVPSDESRSVGSKRSTRELVNFTLAIENPRDRLIRNPKYSTPIVPSIARFVWMMAGSDRLADIAYYEPRVSSFSDDGLSVPGSNYGMRMLQSRPGLDQLAGVIAELSQRRSSRRALTVIYQPEDATRQHSSDIPCVLGFDYLIRDGRLLATTIMRSNNAVTLLPFNLFEFSLLAEVIAAEVGVEVGPLSHFALSMHIYDDQLNRANEIVAAGSRTAALPMEPMPTKSLAKIKQLARFEAELRHNGGSLNDANIESWIKKSEDPKLGPYWGQFYLVLLLHAASRNGEDLAKAVSAAIHPPFLELLPGPLAKPMLKAHPSQANLFGQNDKASAPIVLDVLKSRRMQSLKKHLEIHEERTGQHLSIDKVWNLQEHFARLAARDSGSSISTQEFAAALEKLSTKTR
jgi:hypothetical protein